VSEKGPWQKGHTATRPLGLPVWGSTRQQWGQYLVVHNAALARAVQVAPPLVALAEESIRAVRRLGRTQALGRLLRAAFPSWFQMRGSRQGGRR